MVAIAVTTLMLTLAGLIVVYRRMQPAGPWASSVALSLGCALVGALPWLFLAPVLLPGLPATLHWPVAALGAVAGVLATLAVRACGATAVSCIAFSMAWSLLAFVPAAALGFAPHALGLGIYSPVDHGGSLALHVAAGAGATGVLLACRATPRPAMVRIPAPVAAGATVLLTAGWLAWLVAAELDLDAATGAILVNGLIGAIGGALGWLGVQRIRHGSTSVGAVTAGVLCGLIAVSAGAPLFTPVSAAAAGVMAGAVACWVTIARVSATGRITWFVAGAHLVAGAIGMFALGLLGNAVGYIFTGQTEFILGQLGATAAVALWSGAVAYGLSWMLVHAGGARTTAVPVSRRLATLED